MPVPRDPGRRDPRPWVQAARRIRSASMRSIGFAPELERWRRRAVQFVNGGNVPAMSPASSTGAVAPSTSG